MFVRICWWLNWLHLSGVAAGLRWLAYQMLPRAENFYADEADPNGVVAYGYYSWVDVPLLGCVAFRRTGDRSLQFRW